VTSVGEKKEKANLIQPPLLVFFSPSKERIAAIEKQKGI